MATIIIDDVDSRIRYSAGWSRAGSDREFNHTTTTTTSVGATAELAFLGTHIAVYGTISISGQTLPSVSEYSIDGGPPVQFIGTTTVAPGLAAYNQIYFESPLLSDGTHTITITNIGEENPLWLDYFLVTPPAALVASTVTATVTSTVALPGQTIIVTAGLDRAPQATNLGSSSGSTGRLVEVGAVLGGVLGGLTLLLLLLPRSFCANDRKSR
ncbi:hypothetical protein FA15DRAFT_702857 [Coprinopsis marcescibilis]|uniref:Uncharacterized protein n=1 Tax=Coprinopsis marcescibilis TaxID=230819 RepID=A0A5C3L128_COPMA|nr:hypothetical protein FA15DRAFT_702857 [Coprinopsis marcescibilis]